MPTPTEVKRQLRYEFPAPIHLREYAQKEFGPEYLNMTDALITNILSDINLNDWEISEMQQLIEWIKDEYCIGDWQRWSEQDCL